ncbi:hypothetical protein THRCLA_00568 [Thraustotheca clavata]|uniref:Uncharacterized protein n=1 Tax=Thraustotheca clavata TaxID=74557 RepID=A0A1W0AB51_9STRA|nr:hypothetical protein THRCLA_00568 [Thraustotheca clavata]
MKVKSLVELSACAAAQRSLDEIVDALPGLPTEGMKLLWTYMSPRQLRGLELLIVDKEILQLMDDQWRFCIEHDVKGLHHKLDPNKHFFSSSDSTTFVRTTSIVATYRHAYWESQFRALLAQMDQSVNCYPLELFQDVVREVKIRGKEMTIGNVKKILALSSVERVEIHHFTPLEENWDLLTTIVKEHQTLKEVCILHSKLPTLQPLLDAFKERSFAPIRVLGFSSVKFLPKALKEFIDAFTNGRLHLKRLRMNNSIVDHSNLGLLLECGGRLLETLVLQFNELENEELMCLTPSSTIQHLSLCYNGITSAIPLFKWTNLVSLDLSGNTMEDMGIMELSTQVLPHLKLLQHLYLVSCGFTDQAAESLLEVLAKNQNIVTLNISRNYLSSAVSAYLAHFLAHNSSITELHINSIGLGDSGGQCNLLYTAIKSNLSLQQLSIGENRLRDAGAVPLFSALIHRSANAGYKSVDLRGNLISDKGLMGFAAVVESVTRKRKLQDMMGNRPWLVNELNLQDNSFTCSKSSYPLLKKHIQFIYSNEWTSAASTIAYDDEA